MIYTSSKIKNIQQCPFKGYLSTFKYNTEQNKYLHILSLYKKAIPLSLKDFGQFFDENVDMKFYTFKQEMEVDRNIFVRNMMRFSRYLHENYADVSEFKGKKLINYLGQDIRLSIDFVIKYPDRVELVKLSQSDPKLSYGARSDENKPENNFELYLMQLLGQQLYPDTEVSTAFYHLKGRYDGTKSDNKEYYDMFLKGDRNDLYAIIGEQEENKLSAKGKREANKCDTIIKKVIGVVEFEGSKGSHIIKSDFYNKEFIDDQLSEAFDKELNVESEKCVSSKCSECQYYVVCQAKQYKHVKLNIVEEKKTGSGKNTNIKPTDSQQQYIDFEKGFARINAGAGSGKTNTTVLRTARLLETVEPKDIIMITFTNKGAEEMGERIEKYSDLKASDLRISTFNSFGMNIIEKEYRALGYTEVPELIDKIEKVEIIKEILNMEEFNNLEWLNYKYPMLNMPRAKGAVYQVLEWLNAYSNDRSLLESVSIDRFEDDMKCIFYRYKDILVTRNKLEYSDQINKAITLFSEDNSLIEKYGAKHIIVDEFQDTDKKQIELLKLLTQCSYFESLVVVGDTAQAIYGFRGTTPENMINFGKDFPDYTDIFMEDNFRSSSEICNLGNHLDQLCNKRVDKAMKSFKGSVQPWQLAEYDTLDDEYSAIAERIVHEIANSKKYQDIAVLTRTRGELLAIQKHLNKANIPTRLATPPRHMDNHNIRLAINLAKYLRSEDVDVDDYYLFEFFLGLGHEVTTIEDVIDMVDKHKEKILELEEWGEDRFGLYVELVELLFDKEDDTIAMEFVGNLLEYKKWITFREYADHVTKYVVYQDDSQAEKDENKYEAVTLITAHSSKGLEWDMVITSINKFHYEDLKTTDDLDEERRLLFVTVTRAKNDLIITYNTGQDKSRGKGNYCGFVDEIKSY